MTYETKNITFHVIRVKVSIKSRSSRTLPMNLHSCATLESRDGKRSWDQDSHGLNFDDEYDKFNESHEQKKKLGRDETFAVKSGDGDYDGNNDTHDLGLDVSQRECILDGETGCHEKNEGYVDKRLCTFCGYCQGPSLTKEN